MEIIKKISAISQDLHGAEIPVIAFLGDSVTQGCFEVYMKNEKDIETVYEQQYACSAYVSEILHKLYPQADVCIVNAGISGDDVKRGAARVDKHVLKFQPDLVVVGYGLNDCNYDIEQFRAGIREIFGKLKEHGCEVIYLTPNMMNTYVDNRISNENVRLTAKHTQYMQMGGILDTIVEEGKKAAREYDVRVCDIYEKWKLMYENGVDVTALLANKMNHPDRQMNRMTAYEVVSTMMK